MPLPAHLEVCPTSVSGNPYAPAKEFCSAREGAGFSTDLSAEEAGAAELGEANVQFPIYQERPWARRTFRMG